MRDQNAAAVELADADLESISAGKQKPAPAAKKAGGAVQAALPAGSGPQPRALTMAPARQQQQGGCPGGVCPV